MLRLPNCAARAAGVMFRSSWALDGDAWWSKRTVIILRRWDWEMSRFNSVRNKWAPLPFPTSAPTKKKIFFLFLFFLALS